MKRWKTIVTLLAAVALAYVTFAPVANTQPSGWLSFVHQDPQGVVQFRAMGAYGAPGFIGVGTAAPTFANSGLAPINGEAFVVRDNAGANEPVVTVYSNSATAWRSFSVSTLATNAPDVANSVWFGTNQLIFEGATADANEAIVTAADTVLGDVTLTIPIDNAQWDGAGTFVLSDLITNAPDEVNGVWFEANTMVFEGAQDGFETRITPTSAGQDLLWTLPDIGAATGAIMFSTLATNNVDVANSVWFTANTLNFGGATGGDGFELQITPEDHAVADRVVAINDYDAGSALVHSLLATNAPDANNAVWLTGNTIIFEGATGGDAFEINLAAADSTVGVDTYQLMDRALAADTYELVGVPDVVWTTGNLYYGMDPIAAVAAAADADDTFLVRRIYIPHTVTVTHVDTTTNPLANASAGDNTIAVGLYYDADAGVQIVELVGATDDGAGAATQLETLDIADTTLNPGWYRIGFCAQDASDHDLEVHVIHADNLLITGAGAAAGDIFATGTACTNGDPPATTGALTTDASAVNFQLRTQ